MYVSIPVDVDQSHLKNLLPQIWGWMVPHLFTLFPISGHVGFQPVTKSEYSYADIFVFFYELSFIF